MIPASRLAVGLRIAAPAQLLFLVSLIVLGTGLTHAGPFTYALDDAYIHLAIAKNFALHGVWGVSRYEFASASSSPLWTCLLAALMRLFGNNAWWPLIINVPAGLLFALAVALILHDAGLNSRWAAWGTILTCALLPLPTLTLIGLEHILQCTLVLLFLRLVVHLYAAEPGAEIANQAKWQLIALAAAMPITRYECLFVILPAFFLLWRRGKSLAILTGVAAVLPIAVFGLLSMRQGWPPVPNSIWIKAGTPGQGTFVLLRCLQSFGECPGMVAVVAVLACLLPWARARGEKQLVTWCGLLLTIALLHACFARFGWLYRYEAYLLAVGIPVICIGAQRFAVSDGGKPPLWKYRYALLPLAALCLTAGGQRLVLSLQQTTQGMAHIRDQQFQMARFVGQNFAGGTVAANDIGAIMYFNDVHCLDLAALASLDISRLRRAGNYSSAELDKLSREKQVQVAMLFRSWFEAQGPLGVHLEPGQKTILPASWRPAGIWTMRNALWEDEVTFYAVGSESQADLRGRLRKFAPELPSRVTSRYVVNVQK